MDRVNVLWGRRVVDFGDGERLKSTLALSTHLPIETINDIVGAVRSKLSKQRQPVLPRDIVATTHVTMIEMGFKEEADIYMKFVMERRDSRRVPKERITFIKCEYCSTVNDAGNTFCISCGHPLDKDKAESKVI
jgi:hypothetical protein